MQFMLIVLNMGLAQHNAKDVNQMALVVEISILQVEVISLDAQVLVLNVALDLAKQQVVKDNNADVLLDILV